MAKKADILWKAIIEDIFEDFLLFIYPPAKDIIDFSKGAEFLDKELDQVFPPEEDQFSPKVVDKLIKLSTLSGQEEWILVHLEVQGKYSADFNERMLTYYYRILDKYRKPITAFVIFTEPFMAKRTNQYERNFMGTRLLYQFNTFKISHQKDEDLLASDNPFALVVLSAKTAFANKNIKTDAEHDKALRDLKFTIVKALHAKGYPEEKIKKIMNFLRFYVNFKTKEINDKFENDIQLITKTNKTMGIEELIIAMAEDRGQKIGFQLGEKIGEDRGQKIGLKLGEERAEKRAEIKNLAEKKQIVKNLKKRGFANDDIAETINLPLHVIESL